MVRLAACQSGFEMTVAVDVAAQRCGATAFFVPARSRIGKSVYGIDVRCKWGSNFYMCIGNNHSTIGARRMRAESGWMGRFWRRLVRRMVVVFRGKRPGNRAFSPGRKAPERRFADLMAGRQTFEPEVAV